MICILCYRKIMLPVDRWKTTRDRLNSSKSMPYVLKFWSINNHCYPMWESILIQKAPKSHSWYRLYWRECIVCTKAVAVVARLNWKRNIDIWTCAFRVLIVVANSVNTMLQLDVGRFLSAPRTDRHPQPQPYISGRRGLLSIWLVTGIRTTAADCRRSSE